MGLPRNRIYLFPINVGNCVNINRMVSLICVDQKCIEKSYCSILTNPLRATPCNPDEQREFENYWCCWSIDCSWNFQGHRMILNFATNGEGIIIIDTQPVILGDDHYGKFVGISRDGKPLPKYQTMQIKCQNKTFLVVSLDNQKLNTAADFRRIIFFGRYSENANIYADYYNYRAEFRTFNNFGDHLRHWGTYVTKLDLRDD